MKTLLLAATLALSIGADAAPDAPATGVLPKVALSPYDDLIQTAQAQFDARKFVGAQKTIEAALELAQTPKEKSDALWRLGQALDGQWKYAEAREAWQQRLPMVQDSPDELYLARFYIASTYFNQKMWQQVVDELPALIDDPHTKQKGTLRFQLAMAYAELKRGEEARAQVTSIMTDDESPKELRDLAQFVIGESYFNESNLDAAYPYFDWVTKQPDIPSKTLIRVYQRLGAISEQEGKPKDTEAAFDKARGLLRREMSEQYKAGNWDGLIENYRDLLQMGEPDCVTKILAHSGIAAALKAQGKDTAAIVEIQVLLDILPDPADATQRGLLDGFQIMALDSLAGIYTRQKDYERARATLNTLLARPQVDSAFSPVNLSLRQRAKKSLKALPPESEPAMSVQK